MERKRKRTNGRTKRKNFTPDFLKDDLSNTFLLPNRQKHALYIIRHHSCPVVVGCFTFKNPCSLNTRKWRNNVIIRSLLNVLALNVCGHFACCSYFSSHPWRISATYNNII